MSIYATIAEIGADENGDYDGTVLEYINSTTWPNQGWEASLHLAEIPAWCVPGCDDETSNQPGPYLRVSINDEDVLLTETAGWELWERLNEWLTTPKTQPKE